VKAGEDLHPRKRRIAANGRHRPLVSRPMPARAEPEIVSMCGRRRQGAGDRQELPPATSANMKLPSRAAMARAAAVGGAMSAGGGRGHGPWPSHRRDRGIEGSS